VQAVALTLWTGFAATALSLALVLGFCASAHQTRFFRRSQALLAPLLALPHAALAIGFGFLVAPSGFLFRLLSPWATGLDRPPDLAIVHDPWGLALIAGLALKEAPFLLLMALATWPQLDAPRALRAAASLGYRPVRGFALVLLPRLLPLLRLPIAAVLAFSLSVVDVALLLGPSDPPTLAVLVLRDFLAPDLARWFPGAAGAVLLLALVLAALAATRGGEALLLALLRRLAQRGARGGEARLARAAIPALFALLLATSAAAALLLLAWSFAGLWRFPDALPQNWTLATWIAAAPALAEPARTTLALGLATATAALLLAIVALEAESRGQARWLRAATPVLCAALWLPQIAFLFGLQILLVRLGWDGALLAVAWLHLLFVLPYVLLTLADPWRALDPRFARTGAALGASRTRTLLALKLPLLLRPLLAAWAVGFAVSVGLYLPTLFGGAGRVATLATEAITLASGADRRVLAAFALLQAALPLLAYAAALALPAWLFRHRAGMRGA
jgi:putative thiamine transport system permease protein